MEGVVLKKLPQSQVACEVTVPYAEVAAGLAKAAAALSERLEIKGFRKGKAPHDVVRRHIGDARILEEAAYALIEKKYREIVAAHALRTVGQPKVEITKLAEGNPLTFRLTVAVYPEVILPDYKKIAAEAKTTHQPVAVNDTEVNDALAWMQKSRRKEVAVARAAAQGDLVEVDFTVRSDGVKIEGGESKNHPVVLGEGRFMSGFEDALVSMRAGEEKSFSLVAPDDYPNKGLRGKQLDFSVHVRGVYEIILPALDDAFATSLGKFETMAALAQSVRDGLTAEKKKDTEEAVRRAVAETIAAGVTAEIPDLLIDQEVKKMAHELEESLRGQGLDLAGYCAHLKKTEDGLARDFRPQAATRVKIALALTAIAAKENITVHDAEVKERAQKITAHRAPEEMKGIDPVMLSRYVAGIIQNEKVFALLLGT